MIKLVGSDGRAYELPPGRTSIGRAGDNHMVALRPLVSRWHAAVYYNGRRCAIVDLGSTHGTVLNGQRLPPQKPFPLQGGDQLALAGQLLFQVQEADPAGITARRQRRGTSPIVVAMAALALVLLVLLLLLAVLYVRGA